MRKINLAGQQPQHKSGKTTQTLLADLQKLTSSINCIRLLRKYCPAKIVISEQKKTYLRIIITRSRSLQKMEFHFLGMVMSYIGKIISNTLKMTMYQEP